MKKYFGELNIGAWAAQFDADGYLWLSDFNYGGLYKCDTENKKITLEHLFDGQDAIHEELHCEMVIRGDDIIFVPLCDKYIRVYNKKKKNEHCILVPDEKIEHKTAVFDDNVYCLVGNCLAYRFNYKNMEFVKDRLLTDALKEIQCENTSLISIGAGDSLTLWNEANNFLVDIDVNKHNYKIIKITSVEDKVKNVFHLNGKYWFIYQYSSKVVSRDETSDKYTDYSAISFEYFDGKSFLPYSAIVKFYDQILLPNYYGRYFMRVNESEQNIERLFGEKEGGKIGGLPYGACYKSALVYDNYLYCIPQRSKNIVKFNKELNVVDIIPMFTEIDDVYYEKIIMGSGGKILNEDTGAMSLRNLLVYLKAYGK